MEQFSPVRKCLIRGDNGAGFFISVGDKSKKQVTLFTGYRRISDFINDWVVFDIPVVSKIEEDSIPGKQGINDFGRKNYGGPCPPSGIHRYFFKIYALDTMLNLEEGISKRDLEKAMEGHILDEAELIGLYKR